MTFKISSSRSVGFGQANRTSSEFAKSNLHPNTDGQNKTAFEHLGKTLSDKPDGAPEPAKTLQNFLDKVLAEQPIDENLKKKNAVLIIEPNKPPAEMSAADYKRAFHRALLKKAGYENLSEAELTMAMNLHPVDLKNFDIENLRREDAKPGVMTIDADEFTIAAANRAAQAVLQYQTDRAEKSTEAKAKAESETNQMLIEPFKLGGNVPVRWLERILNTPKELLRQIDKGEIMPGSSTAKWIGGKIGEYITGKPAPPMKTASESIEELTGAKLPAIPDVELPRPFEYKTDKYKTDGKTGEDVGATAIDTLLLKRGITGKPNVAPESLGNLNISKVFRVQGGVMPKASKFRISIGEAGEMVVKDKTNLFVTFDDMNRVKVFNGINRAGKAEVISFEVKTSFVQQVRKFAVREKDAGKFSDLPKISDPTKTNNSFGLPANWIEMLKESSFRGTGKIEKLETSTPALHKLFPAVTLSNQLERKPE